MTSINDQIAAEVEQVRQQIMASLWKVGTVTGTQSSPVRVIVSVQGGSMTIPRLSLYTPTVGDVVMIASTPLGWIAYGKIA